MAIDERFYIFRTTIAHFYCVAIEYLVELMSFGKMFVEECQETMSDFGGYRFTVWWIEPNYFVFTVVVTVLRLLKRGIICQTYVITRVSESSLVHWFCVVEYVL